jgi:hypothetical protein
MALFYKNFQVRLVAAGQPQMLMAEPPVKVGRKVLLNERRLILVVEWLMY